MHQAHFGAVRKGPTGDVDTGDATTDNCEKDESVKQVCKPGISGLQNGDHKWAFHGSGSRQELWIVRRYTHANQPDAADEERGHSPEQRQYCLSNCFPGVRGLTSANGNDLTYSEYQSGCLSPSFCRAAKTNVHLPLTSADTEASLDEGLTKTLDAILECVTIGPISELNRAMGPREASRCHDKQEDKDGSDCDDLAQRQPKFEFTIPADVEQVYQDHEHNEDRNPRCHGDIVGPVRDD